MNNKSDHKAEERNSSEHFQSDAERLANKHLSDPDHVITDEELASVRIGMTPPLDEPTREAIEDRDKKIADHKSDSEEDAAPGGQKLTPWDVVE